MEWVIFVVQNSCGFVR